MSDSTHPPSHASDGADYDAVARFYDLTYAGFEDDLALYIGFAERTGSPILEVGCGTGRVAIPLAKAGFRVTGVDSSAEMLALARKKAEAAGVSGYLTLVQSDVRRLALPEHYALATIATNSFGLFCEQRDQLEVLDSIHRALQPDGLLIIDTFNPDPSILSSEDGLLFHDFTRVDPATGHTVVKMRSQKIDLARQVISATFFYDEIMPDGTMKRLIFPFDTRYFFPAELELLLEKCDYIVEALYGSYDLEPIHSESERIIAVASPIRTRARK